MKISRLEISSLKDAPYNPRTISRSALDGLAASVKRFGIVQPVVWNERTGHVVGGHQRLRVLRESGETAVDVVVVDLPEDEERALNLTLNNPGVTGAFSEGLDDVLTSIEDQMPTLEFDALNLDALYDSTRLAMAELQFGAAPESVKANIEEMAAIGRSGRAEGAELTPSAKPESLTILFPTHEEKKSCLERLGLPEDECFVPAGDVRIRRARTA